MQLSDIPWRLLLSKLRSGEASPVSRGEVVRAGGDPDVLVRSKLLERVGADAYQAPACRHGALPNFDFQRRVQEGLVGVACPGEPACWPGWAWVTWGEVELLRIRPAEVLSALAARHALAPLSDAVPAPFVSIGLMRRRGLAVPVVWLRAPGIGFQPLCRGLRAQLGQDGLVVVVARKPAASFAASERIQVLELAADDSGTLHLDRALEELTPGYRERVVEDVRLDLDYVRIRFSTAHGVRHAVHINGHDFGGFRRSDVKFMRLLLLAAARKNGANDGWIDKSRLRDGDDKDRALERLREELVTYDVPGLREAERRALIRTHRGRLRLGVPPEHIELDDSLAHLELVGEAPRACRAKAAVTPKQREGLQNARVLLRDCRRLGAPGEVEALTRRPGQELTRSPGLGRDEPVPEQISGKSSGSNSGRTRAPS
jgi:hypothetical protein